jgi:hypothetical protein
MRLEAGNSGSNRVQGWSLVLRVPRHGTLQSGARSMHSVVRVSLRVDGIPWKQVEALKSAQPNDQVFVVSIADDGTMTVKFGDGKCGRRLPTGLERISALYRTGAGSAGNVPGKPDQASGGGLDLVYLDVWSREFTVIEDVHLSEPALDGPDTSIRGQ